LVVGRPAVERLIEVREVPIAVTRPLRRAVLRPHETLAELTAGEAPGTIALGGFVEAELVGVGLITPSPSAEGWRVRGMATAPRWRGQGVGSAVLAALVARARAADASRVWCNARTPALSLYERAGFVREGEEFELPMIGPHYVVALTL
jgi:GNAT superfamily N-acetyltransferase